METLTTECLFDTGHAGFAKVLDSDSPKAPTEFALANRYGTDSKPTTRDPKLREIYAVVPAPFAGVPDATAQQSNSNLRFEDCPDRGAEADDRARDVRTA